MDSLVVVLVLAVQQLAVRFRVRQQLINAALSHQQTWGVAHDVACRIFHP